MVDMPSCTMKVCEDYGRVLKKCHRDFKADLMLAAIEENSGHMIILAAVEWGKIIDLRYDGTRNEHDRIVMTNHSSNFNKFNG